MSTSSPPSGPVKLELCQRLRDTWRDLADHCEIPPYARDRFQQGYEAQGVWEWLEGRRLGELPEALRAIGRDELAKLLVERRAESADAYYLAAIARWSQPCYALDRQFVNLTLLLDQGADTPGPRWQAKDHFQDLREVLTKPVRLTLIVADNENRH